MADLAILEGEECAHLDDLFNCNDALGVAICGADLWRQIKAAVCDLALKTIHAYRCGASVGCTLGQMLAGHGCDVGQVLCALGPNVAKCRAVCGPEFLGWNPFSSAWSGIKKAGSSFFDSFSLNPVTNINRAVDAVTGTVNFLVDTGSNVVDTVVDLPSTVYSNWKNLFTDFSVKNLTKAVFDPAGFFGKQLQTNTEFLDVVAPGASEIIAATPAGIIAEAIVPQHRPVPDLTSSVESASYSAAMASRNRQAWEFCQPIAANFVKDGISEDVAEVCQEAGQYTFVNLDATLDEKKRAAILSMILKLIEMLGGVPELMQVRFVFDSAEVKGAVAAIIDEYQEAQTASERGVNSAFIFGGLGLAALLLLRK